MTIDLPAFLKPSVNSKRDRKVDNGQTLLERDWRYQEIEAAIYHRNLTNSLTKVWQNWVAELNQTAPQPVPEFSTLRKTPAYLHESDDKNANIQSALARGGSVIMACPLLSSSCSHGHLCIKIKWQADQLVFTLKNPRSIYQPSKKLKFYDLNTLVGAILGTIGESPDFNSEYLLQNQGIAAF